MIDSSYGGSKKKRDAELLAYLKAANTPAPNTAFVLPGQKAIGLANTPNYGLQPPGVDVNSGIFAGSGSPLGATPMFDLSTKNIVNAALTATMLPGNGQFSSWLANKAANYVGRETALGTWGVAAKGLNTISSGGKVSKTFTPMGPTLKSTRIMNPAQKSAALKGLTTRAEDITNAALKFSSQATARLGRKIIRGTFGAAKITALAAAIAANKKPDRIGGY